MPCVMQTWWWVGRQVDRDRLADAGCGAEAACGDGPDGLPRVPPKAGSAFLTAAAVDPLITASLAAVSSAQGSGGA